VTPSKDPSPCFRVRCPFYGICRVKEGGAPYCACSNSCEKTYKPVCASDDRSYFNKCFLRKNSCRLRQLITVKYIGLCSKSFFLCFVSFSFSDSVFIFVFLIKELHRFVDLFLTLSVADVISFQCLNITLRVF